MLPILNSSAQCFGEWEAEAGKEIQSKEKNGFSHVMRRTCEDCKVGYCYYYFTTSLFLFNLLKTMKKYKERTAKLVGLRVCLVWRKMSSMENVFLENVFLKNKWIFDLFSYVWLVSRKYFLKMIFSV